MNDQALREHVLYLLKGGGAHLNFEQAIADLSEDLRGAKVKGVSHTPWRLLEHLRICQWDILEFSRNPEHVSPDFQMVTGPRAMDHLMQIHGTRAFKHSGPIGRR